MIEKRDIVLNQEEKKIGYYKDYLENLVNQDPPSPDIFSNRGAAHASILMATLMAHTEHKIDMYCTGLRPGILCGKDENDPKGFRGAYWEEFKRFFSVTLKEKTYGRECIRILIQTEEYLENAPFHEVSKALNNVDTRNKIIVKRLADGWKEKIENTLGKEGNNLKFNYNFAIYDNMYFRLEYEADSYRALGSFRNDPLRERLSKLFEDAFNAAGDITERVRELTA